MNLSTIWRTGLLAFDAGTLTICGFSLHPLPLTVACPLCNLHIGGIDVRSFESSMTICLKHCFLLASD